MKKLYFGDCLDVLKELHKEHPSGFIDLIYIDPPFNSGDKFDKIQILTVEDLLNGDGVNIPTSTMGTFKTAVKKKKGGNEQLELTE